MQEYYLVKGSADRKYEAWENLKQNVSVYLESGWVVVGGPVAYGDYLLQAVVRDKKAS